MGRHDDIARPLDAGGLAEFERDLIRARTGEGRARAVRAAENGATAQTNAAPKA
jgi:DNA invertase Pin-like site-specific DNA recombinase